MNITTQRTVGLIIMTIGLIIGVYAIIVSLSELYDVSILIFLIGIIINDWAIYKLVGRYEAKYGDIEE